MVSNPLCITEILSQILQWLEDDPTSLKVACQVNSLWFEEATNVLWRDVPHYEALDDIAPSRRQIYANKLRLVRFRVYADYVNDILHSLKYPRLKYLRIQSDPSRLEGRYNVDQYFQPALEKLWIEFGDIPEALLNRTAFQVPRLREIRMNCRSESVNSSRFLRLLHELPSVTSMYFEEEMEHLMTDQALTYFVNRENLESLKLSAFFTRASIENAISLALHPSKNIQCLAIGINSDSIPPLV